MKALLGLFQRWSHARRNLHSIEETVPLFDESCFPNYMLSQKFISAIKYYFHLTGISIFQVNMLTETFKQTFTNISSKINQSKIFFVNASVSLFVSDSALSLIKESICYQLSWLFTFLHLCKKFRPTFN